MRRNPDPFFWLNNPEWYRLLPAGGYEMTEKAPKEAVASFEKWKKAWGI